MKNWIVELIARGKSFAVVKIHKGIFQGDVLSPLLDWIAKMPLNHVLRKCTGGYKFTKSQEKINHQMNMDDIEQFVKKEKELETLIQTIRIYSQDIGMELRMYMKSNKREITEGIELPNQEKIRTFGKKNYEYLGILDADTIIRVEMKKKVSLTNKKTSRDQAQQHELIKGINIWVVQLERYSGPTILEMDKKKT